MSYFTTRSGRIVAGTLAGALALSVTPIVGLIGTAGAAAAPPPVAEPIGAGNFCANGPTTEPFTDVSSTDPSLDEIMCLVGTALTSGTTATTYSPNASITRRQMALFIKRLADKANALDTGTKVAPLPAYDGVPDYTDVVTESAEVQTAVGQLSQAGIVMGTTATTYSPAAPVSRRQMAAFVNRLQKFQTGTAYVGTKDYFNDDNGDTGEANLNAMAEKGIFQGDGVGNVSPGANLSRRQMANVLLRDAEVNLEAGNIKPAFTPAPPASNQTYTVTPVTEGRADFGALPTATTTRSFVATVPSGTVVDIRLFPNTSIMTTATGTTPYAGAGPAFFADSTPANNVADGAPPAGSSITTINGVPAAGGVGDQITSTGTINFVVTSTLAADLFPVVFADAADDDSIALVAPTPGNSLSKAPADAVGIGGRTHFTAVEAALGAIAGGGITEINANLNYFVENAATYEFDANDVYQYGGIATTMAEFEGLVTIAGGGAGTDVITGAYSPDPAGTSTFNVTSPEGVPAATAPAAPAVVAMGTNLDGGATNNDVVLNWTLSAQPDATYTITRDVDNSGTVSAGDVTLATGVTGTTKSFNNEPTDATAQYVIQAVGGKTAVKSAPLTHAPIVMPAPADAAAPLATDAVVTGNGGLGGTLDAAGDVFKVVFNEAMGAPAAGDTIRATDADPAPVTIADFINGTNATFSLNAVAETVNGASRAANTVLTVALTGPPATIQAGSASGLQIPATITDQSGNGDLAGNLWNVAAGGQDLLIDQDAADTVASSADATAPTTLSATTTTDGGVVGALDATDVITLVFSEAMTAPTAGDSITVTEGTVDGDAGVLLCGTNATCTLATTNTANDTIVVTVTVTPAGGQYVEGGGGDDVNVVVALPGSITATVSNTDASGNAWALGGDVTV